MADKVVNEEHWTEKASSDLEYYLDTENGRKELSEMIKKQTELQLQEVISSKQGLKEVIWLSKHCNQCSHFLEGKNSMKCIKFKSKIVKPFYGKPIWSIQLSDIEESHVKDVDWNSKSSEVSDKIIKKAIDKINKGYPYFCFEMKE